MRLARRRCRGWRCDGEARAMRLVLPPVALLVKRPAMRLETELELRLVLPPSAFWSSVPRWRVPLPVRWGFAPCPSPYRPRHSFEASGRFRLQVPDGPWPVQRRARHLHRVEAPIPSGASLQSQRARAGEIRRRGRATMVWNGRRRSSVLQGDGLAEARIARRKK